MDAAPPVDINGVILNDSTSVQPLGGEATIHGGAPFLLECRDIEVGDAMLLLQSAHGALGLGSDASFRKRALVAMENDHVHVHVFERERTWGPLQGPIGSGAVAFARAHGSRVAGWMRSETFDRVANAYRLYATGLQTESPDAALVLLVSCLEGLFTGSSENISFKLALGAANLMRQSAEDRLRQFDRVKSIYTMRSKIVHGGTVSKDDERAAILLVDNILPEAEELARLTLRKLLTDGLVDVFSRPERADRFLALLALGFDAGRAVEIASKKA
jgi:hypothetical protein